MSLHYSTLWNLKCSSEYLPLGCYRKKLHNSLHLNCGLQICQIWIIIQVSWEMFAWFCSKFIQETVYRILSEFVRGTYYTKKQFLVSFFLDTVYLYVNSPGGAFSIVLFRRSVILWRSVRYRKSNRQQIETILSIVLKLQFSCICFQREENSANLDVSNNMVSAAK